MWVGKIMHGIQQHLSYAPIPSSIAKVSSSIQDQITPKDQVLSFQVHHRRGVWAPVRSSIGPDLGGEALRQQLPSNFAHYVSARGIVVSSTVCAWSSCSQAGGQSFAES